MQRTILHTAWLGLWRPTLLAIALALLALPFDGGRTGVRAQEEPAVQRGGAMAVDCNDATPQVDRECQYGEGQEFTAAIHITQAVSPNYSAFQAKLRWDGAVVDYLPASDPRNEADWPDCTIPARAVNRPAEPSLLFGCVPFTGDPSAPRRTSTYTGKALHFAMKCRGGGMSPLTLVEREGDPQNGSHFLDEPGNPVAPSLTGAQVTCGGAPAPPGQTPGGPGPVGPTATPGGPIVAPGTTTVTPTATLALTGTPPAAGEEDEEDEEDGGGPGVGVWVAIGVVAAIGVAGLGFLGWRRLRARAGGT